MPDKKVNWGEALKGTGAWFAGRGPEYEALQRKKADELRQRDMEGGLRGTVRALDIVSSGRMGEIPNLLAEMRGVLSPQAYERFEADFQGDPQTIAANIQANYREALGMGDLKAPSGTAERRFSAMTRVLPDGSVLQADNFGGTRLTGPDGVEITDPARRAEAIREAQAAEREQAMAVAAATASGTITAGSQAQRVEDIIDTGLRASQQVPILNRNIELLEELKTGGFAGAGLKIQNALGIEGADEAELTTNMARTVLGQLKDTFGSQFTEKEGKRLERIEAGIGKSTDGNRRIIEQLLRLAKFKSERAVRLARDKGDLDAVTEIEANLGLSLTPVGSASKIKILNIR